VEPSHWLWEGEEFKEEHIEDFFGFVYCITNTQTNKKYIGRKYFYSTNRIKQKGKKNRKVVRKQSNWADYYGSSKNLLADIEAIGKEHFRREILSLHESRGDVNYNELREQVVRNVLDSDAYYNDNILSRYFRKSKTYLSKFAKNIPL
jgi:hypothetical protein